MEINTTVRLNQSKRCIQCNKVRKPFEGHKVCQFCFKSNILYRPSGNKFVDDFVRNLQINSRRIVETIEFVPYNQFKDIKFIAEFQSYRATWIDGNIENW